MIQSIERRLVMSNLAELDSAIQQNWGAIVFACHMGPYYLLPIAIALKRYKIAIVERLGFVGSPIINLQVRRLNSLLRGRFVSIVSTYDSQMLRKLERHLKEGGIVFLMGDYRGSLGRDAGYVRFLGHDIVPGRGIAWLHRRTGAPVIPLAFAGSRSGIARFEFQSELVVDPDSPDVDITPSVYSEVERQILFRPDCWALWVDYHLMLAPKELDIGSTSGSRLKP